METNNRNNLDEKLVRLTRAFERSLGELAEFEKKMHSIENELISSAKTQEEIDEIHNEVNAAIKKRHTFLLTLHMHAIANVTSNACPTTNNSNTSDFPKNSTNEDNSSIAHLEYNLSNWHKINDYTIGNLVIYMLFGSYLLYFYFY